MPGTQETAPAMTCQVRDTVAQWMPESASEAIQAPILRHFPALVRDLGGDPAAILGAFDLATEACDKEGAVTCRQWVGVLEFAATVLQAEDIGMRLAERQGGVGCFGPLGRVMRNCRNFGDSLNYAATHNAAHSLAVRVWMGRTTSGQSVFMGHELLGEDLSNRMQAIEHALLAGHLAARATTGGRVGARRVHFRHQALAARSVYRRHFQCEVRFCCNEDGLAFAAADMQAPICGPDDVSLPDMIEEIERTYGDRHPPFHAQVRGVVNLAKKRDQLKSARSALVERFCGVPTVDRLGAVMLATLRESLFSCEGHSKLRLQRIGDPEADFLSSRCATNSTTCWGSRR